MLGLYAAFHFIFEGPPGAIQGAIKAGYHFVLGLSAWVVIILLLKLVWWGLVILSIDIVTPPYGIDIETLFAFPLAKILTSGLHLSFGWALALAYFLVFAAAISILLFHFYVYRKKIK